MKMELFSNDKALNVIILVLIVCFLLQIAGVIDLQMLLEDPVCAAIFLLIIAYVSEKEIVVGLLLALVYVMMKGREVEGFTSTGTVTTSTAVAAPTSTAAAAPTSTAAAAPTSTAAAAPTSTAASTSTTLASLVSTSTGGGHPQHLSEIVQQMNGLGANTDDLNVENFIGRDGKHAPKVQKKIDNIRNNLGKIQSTIAALKNTPDSLQ